MADADRPWRVTAIVGHARPYKTGGELYNAHLFQAAADEGIDLRCAALSEAGFERWLDRRVVWRLKPLLRCIYVSWLAWRSPSVRLIDVWLAPYLWPWALFSGRRCLLMVHHLRGQLASSRQQRRWIGWCEARLINRASEILTVSRSSQRQIEAQLRSGVPIRIIPPGFERPQTGKAKPGDDATVHLLYVGAITRAKGVLDLVRALRHLPAQPGWAMHIVGNAEAEPETTQALRREIAMLAEPGRVTMHGRLDAEALAALYAEADAFVLPSHWEGYGIVLLEAMSRGLPVVSTTAGAIPELVEHMHTGLLAAPADVSGLAGALARIVSDAPLRNELGRNALAAAARHGDWQQMEGECRQWWHAWKARHAATGTDAPTARWLPRMKRWLLRRYLSGPGDRRRGHPPADRSGIKRIAVWQFGGIGDMIIGAAVVRDLLAAYPHAAVDLYCSDPDHAAFVAELGERVGAIHRYDAYALDARSIMERRARRHFREVLALHRQRHYDLLVNLHIPKLLDWWFFELLLMRRSGATYLAGFVPEATRPGLLDLQRETPVVVGRHYLSLYRELLAPLGIPIGDRGYFPCKHTARKPRLVVMHPGASVPFKRWPVENFIELGRRLQAQGWQLAIVGDRRESPIGQRMASALPGLINAVGTLDLEEVAGLLASAALFIGNDSAPFHVAVAVGTPSIGIFGAGPPMYSDYPLPDVSVVRLPLACAPCFKNACAHQMECMTRLSVDAVWERVPALLQQPGTERRGHAGTDGDPHA